MEHNGGVDRTGRLYGERADARDCRADCHAGSCDSGGRADAHAYSNIHCNGDATPDRNSNPYANCDSYIPADTYGNCDGIAHASTYGDSRANGDTYIYTDIYAASDRHGYRHSHPAANRHRYGYAGAN
ncbi:MAG: hypothetical protein IT329_16045 [Caldilineaceae bacterium]|nr:hypothetical protein [Caldilineaceae bacterium]